LFNKNSIQAVLGRLRELLFLDWDNGLLSSSVFPILRPGNPRAIIQRTLDEFPTFFGDRFSVKDGGLCIHNLSAEEVGGLEVFLCEAAQNFELYFKV
jgi:hypothetical protein